MMSVCDLELQRYHTINTKSMQEREKDSCIYVYSRIYYYYVLLYLEEIALKSRKYSNYK